MKSVRAQILFWSLLSCSIPFQGITSELLVSPSDSMIEVAVNATGDDFVAELTKFESKITLADSNHVPTSASIGWDFANLKTGKKGRDKEMLHWLNHAEAPKGQFVMTNCEVKDGSVKVLGRLTMHDVARELSIPMKMLREGDRVAFEGSVKLDHRDFDLPKIVKFVVLKVDPVLTIHFKIAGILQGSPQK